tara:strand:- start:293 stop:868 length:576 start_codon:yes stop_codon:yes gene_type:complete
MSRINRVTTQTGDNGTTALGTGRRVSKADPIITALGSVDELSSLVGILKQHKISPQLNTQLAEVQQVLFDLGAILAMEGQYQVDSMDARIDAVKAATEASNATLPPLREFVIPGSNPTNAQCHLCRTVCRRAESNVWGVIEAATDLNTDSDSALKHAGRYLNRLSDFLFVQARILADSAEETQWRGPNSPT